MSLRHALLEQRFRVSRRDIDVQNFGACVLLRVATELTLKWHRSAGNPVDFPGHEAR